MSLPAKPARIVPGLPLAPGTSATRLNQSRPLSGRLATCSGLTFPDSSDFFVSIRGDAAATVTVSCTAATFNVNVTMADWPTARTRFSCTRVEKPVSAASTR